MTTKEQQAPPLTIISRHLCPYVQRAAIVLAEKGVVFERCYIDLADKPDWFHAAALIGKVPLLLVHCEEGDEAILFESAVICDYLEETQPGVALHPADPLERARHRGWIEFGSSILADLWGLETATDSTTYNVQRQVLVEKFTRLETELDAASYFAGQCFSMVDAAYAPAFLTRHHSYLLGFAA